MWFYVCTNCDSLTVNQLQFDIIITSHSIHTCFPRWWRRLRRQPPQLYSNSDKLAALSGPTRVVELCSSQQNLSHYPRRGQWDFYTILVIGCWYHSHMLVRHVISMYARPMVCRSGNPVFWLEGSNRVATVGSAFSLERTTVGRMGISSMVVATVTVMSYPDTEVLFHTETDAADEICRLSHLQDTDTGRTCPRTHLIKLGVWQASLLSMSTLSHE